MHCLGLLAVVVATLVSSVSTQELVRIPLHRRWYNNTTPGMRREQMSYDNGLLVAKIQVGTPKQEFQVLFDTSTSLSWIPSDKCHTKECRSQGDTYKASASSTQVKLGINRSMKYGQGKCIDVALYRDTVTVAGISVKNQLFGSAYSVTGLGDDKYLGMLGLGGFQEGGSTNWLTNSSTHRSHGSHEISKRQFDNSLAFAPGAFQTGFAQGSLSFSMVTTDQSGFFIKRSNDIGGEFIFGGVDHTIYQGSIAYLSLPTCDYGDSPYWKAEAKCVKLGSKMDLKLAPKSFASFSSGTQYMSAPQKQADLLHKAMGAEYDDKDQLFKLKCCKAEKLPNLEITFQGYRISLPNQYWIDKVNHDDKSKEAMCHTLIRRNTHPKDWILGGAFLNQFYHIYDFGSKRIGLALPKGSNRKARIIKTKH